MSDIKHKVGQQIREARKAKGLTQMDLGKILGVSKVTINGYEKGKQNLTIETLEKITKALGFELNINF
jgi:transcriptional regulator with XRE-family HTH domain